MLHDLILDATSKYEIYFLVTAYLESVRYGDKLGMLPKELTCPPCSGIDDIWERLEALNGELNSSPQVQSQEPRRAILREAVALLGMSVRRLRQLEGETTGVPTESRLSTQTHSP